MGSPLPTSPPNKSNPQQSNTIKLQTQTIQIQNSKHQKVKERYPGLVVVDYTTPTCVNGNAEFYASNGVPFVMGTTGGDRAAVAAAAEAAGVYAVVAPQMGKQVVAFQAMMELMAREFPGAFQGYNLTVTESHQRNKADVSGTAKAVVASMQRMGVEGFSEVGEVSRAGAVWGMGRGGCCNGGCCRGGCKGGWQGAAAGGLACVAVAWA